MIELPEPALKNVNPTRKSWNGKSWVDAGGIDAYTADQLRTYGDQRAAEAQADALQALERVPMTEEVALKFAHRRATTYTHRSDPLYHSYAFVPHTLMDFVRDLEAHHNITKGE